MRRLIFHIVALSSLGLLPSLVHAASLHLTPSTTAPDPGKTVTVTIGVTSTDRSVNAVSGVVLFPTDKLEVVSLSTAGSVLGLWVQEPAFSNTEGRISFEGVVLNPGYTGSGGKIMTLTFRAKGTGTARLSFSSGSVLANDGKGTNILTAMTGTALWIGDGEPSAPPQQPTSETPVPPTEKAATGALPKMPVVRSSTHPNADHWYSENVISFEWDVPKGVTAVRLLLDGNAVSSPSVTYAQPLRSKTVEDVADGVWYFHVQFKNAAGWGPVAHQPVRIDATPPEELLVTRIEDAGSSASFSIQAGDALSGIERFEIQTDDQPPQVWPNAGTAAFTFGATVLEAGQHTLTVTAYDRAGNGLLESQVFAISPTVTSTGEVEQETGSVAAPPRELGWREIPGWVLGMVGFLLGSLGSFGAASFFLRKRRRSRQAALESGALRMTPLAVRGPKRGRPQVRRGALPRSGTRNGLKTK